MNAKNHLEKTLARTCTRTWTFEAILCYKRGCNCAGCINETLETKCRMRDVVFVLVDKFGAPKQKGGDDDYKPLYDPNTRILWEEGEMLQ